MNRHPSAMELVDLIENNLDREASLSVQEHVDNCPACRLYVQTARATVVEDADAPLVPREAGRPARTYAAAQPEAGQIWRMTWDGISALGVVSRNATNLRTMVRLIIDSDDLDVIGDTVSAELAGGIVDVPVMKAAVWIQLATFEACVGALQQQLEPAEELLELGELPKWIESQLPSWADDYVLALIDDLATTLSQLGEADWSPVRDASTAAPVDAGKLVDAGLSGPRAIALARGALPLEDEHPALRAAGIDPDALIAVPSEIRAELDRPQNKVVLLDRARRRHLSERQVRWDLATQLRAPVAARTASGELVSIASRLKELLNE